MSVHMSIICNAISIPIPFSLTLPVSHALSHTHENLAFVYAMVILQIIYGLYCSPFPSLAPLSILFVIEMGIHSHFY